MTPTPSPKIHPCTAYFYLSENSFPHLSICLAEGLRSLGIPVYANLKYWLNSPEPEDYLFVHDPQVHPQDCSVVVMDKNWVFGRNPTLPEAILTPSRNYLTVYLDDMDGPRPSLVLETIPKFDFIFRTHCHNRASYPSNFVPWCFGLSNRILRSTENLPSFQERRASFLFNFRVDQTTLLVSNWVQPISQGMLLAEKGVIFAEYPLRSMMREQFLPAISSVLAVDETIDSATSPPAEAGDRLYWDVTGHRHHPHYYQRLKYNQACATFAGWLIPASPTQPSYVEWWDSWRFWEALGAGCVAFHVDFDKYGLDLPVKPENWTHYIGVDLDDIPAAIDRLVSEPTLLSQISQGGRQWVRDHYAPLPTTLRFLDILGFKSVTEILPFDLREINFIAFPDWSKPETELYQDLAQLLKRILTHSDRHQISLLIDTSNTTPEIADQILSQITLNLLLLEEVPDPSDSPEPEIILLESLTPSQWQVLGYHLQARIPLIWENQEALTRSSLPSLPTLS